MSQSQYSDEDEEYDGYDSYYQDDCYESDGDVMADDSLSHSANDPEYFDFKALSTEDVEKLLNESVAKLLTNIEVTPSLAKMLLHHHKWSIDDIIGRYRKNSKRFLEESQLQPENPAQLQSSQCCDVCLCESESMLQAGCGHAFCKLCWTTYIERQVQDGHCTDIECMAGNCNIILTEDMVLDLISSPHIREKYQRFAYQAYVNRHPNMRFCPGAGCTLVIYAKEKKARKVKCDHCAISFCFGCGSEYHAPTDCETIKMWLSKCIDDSETANYISAHTKDCPKCQVCIEKNGGCNHIQCFKCKHDFCWICEGDWKTHAGEYYVCSKYKDKPPTRTEKNEAREALVKYLHYFARWDNHSRSLKLEAQETEKIKAKIESKVLSAEGTWIDWQYLLDATELLQRCRYTLQYTYPFAYFLSDSNTRKQLFEYQQGKLEAAVEDLSWKVQKAEITDRGVLENQMDIAEKMRQTLLKDFLQS